MLEPQTCPFNGSRNDGCDCVHDATKREGLTLFHKIRINVTSLKVNSKLATLLRQLLTLCSNHNFLPCSSRLHLCYPEARPNRALRRGRRLLQHGQLSAGRIRHRPQRDWAQGVAIHGMGRTGKQAESLAKEGIGTMQKQYILGFSLNKVFNVKTKLFFALSVRLTAATDR